MNNIYKSVKVDSKVPGVLENGHFKNVQKWNAEKSLEKEHLKMHFRA